VARGVAADLPGREDAELPGREDADLPGGDDADLPGRAGEKLPGREDNGLPARREPGRRARGLIAERAYFELRDRIVSLRLPPGTALVEEQLMRELAIGRTPLREAIKRLALENLVEVRPRRGTYVTEVNVADIVHITEVRAELEGYAAQLAAMRMEDDGRTEAEVLLAGLEELDPRDSEGLMRIDERVHRLAWTAAGNPYLAVTLEAYFALSLRVWYLVIDRVPGLWTAVHDQRDMIQALLTRDGPRARELMKEHILAFQREIVVAFTR
jgi:DNA-binding GntR family transcriptional regulator